MMHLYDIGLITLQPAPKPVLKIVLMCHIYFISTDEMVLENYQFSDMSANVIA